MSASRTYLILVLATVLLLAVVAENAAAFSTGPPDGHAGNPPNPQFCTSCHTSFPLNSGDGRLELLGVPAAITPGHTYSLTVRLNDPGQSRWGFELTVINAQNQSSGTIIVTDPDSTQLSNNPAPSPDYLKHTSRGTRPGTAGPKEWKFDWTAGNDAHAEFYVAGNAANNSGTQFGDFIYAIHETAGGGTGVENEEVAASYGLMRLEQNQPNPFNPMTSIGFSLRADTYVTLRIFDATGALVRSLIDGQVLAGDHTVAWEGTDQTGKHLPSGLYFYRLEGSGVAVTKRMTLLK
jgi:hypothetical protein